MKRILITALFLVGVATTLQAQDAYQGYLAYKKAQVETLRANRSTSDKESQKQIDLQLAALDYSVDGSPIANTLEVQIARAQSYRTYYTQIGDLVTAQKYELAITNMTQPKSIELKKTQEKSEK